MFINNLFECNLRPLITKPTKVNMNNPITRFSVLDQIWITEGFSGVESFILPLGITDHFPVCTIISPQFTDLSPIKVKKRPMTARSKETFSILLSNICIDETADDFNYI